MYVDILIGENFRQSSLLILTSVMGRAEIGYWGGGGGVIILSSCEYPFNRVHVYLVQHTNDII